MTRFGNPNGCSMSEFPNGLHGDCGPTASYLAVHAIKPGEFAITAGGLAQWANQQIAAGLAAGNGAQNITSMSEWLTRQGIAHTTYGYAGYSTQQLHNDLQAFGHGSQDPIIVEWSAAGLGLPDDEPGVQYHFSTFFQITPDERAPGDPYLTGGYLRGDGDSRTDHPDGSPSPCVVTSWPEILRAQPIAHIRVYMPAAPATNTGGQHSMWTKQPDGSGVDSKGHTCGAGIMFLIDTAGVTADGLDGETYAAALGLTIPGTESWVPLESDQLIVWTGSTAVGASCGGHLVHTLIHDRQTHIDNERSLSAELLALKNAEPSPAPDPLMPADHHALAVGRAVVQLAAQIADPNAVA